MTYLKLSLRAHPHYLTARSQLHWCVLIISLVKSCSKYDLPFLISFYFILGWHFVFYEFRGRTQKLSEGKNTRTFALIASRNGSTKYANVQRDELSGCVWKETDLNSPIKLMNYISIYWFSILLNNSLICSSWCVAFIRYLSLDHKNVTGKSCKTWGGG